MAANMPWYTAKSKSGILWLPTDGAAKVFLNPIFERSPMNLPAVCEKVREYPQKNHWNEVTPVAIIDNHINESADFLLARPE